MSAMEQETTLSSFPETDAPSTSSSSNVAVLYELEEEDLPSSSSSSQTSGSESPVITIPNHQIRPRGPTSSVLWCELSQLARRLAQLKYRLQHAPEGPQRAKLEAQFQNLSNTKRAIKHMLGPATIRSAEPYESPRIMSRPR